MSQGEQPDLRRTVADAINELAQQHGSRSEQKLPDTVNPEQVSIPCQRTWYGVETLNQKVNGADFSACVAHVTQSDGIYPWFFLLCRLPGETIWQPISSQGGVRQGMVKRVPGNLHVPRTCICAGGLGVVPNSGSIRIELPDGAVHEDVATEGCCIALAPLLYESDSPESATIHYLNPDGSEIEPGPS